MQKSIQGLRNRILYKLKKIFLVKKCKNIVIEKVRSLAGEKLSIFIYYN